MLLINEFSSSYISFCFSIILLEMNAISSGATSKSGAMIREFYQIDFLIEMAKESKKFFEQSDINFIKNGRIYLFSKENNDSVYNNATLNKNLGVNIDVIDIKQIKNLILRFAVFNRLFLTE